jgi:hypothetical protein
MPDDYLSTHQRSEVGSRRQGGVNDHRRRTLRVDRADDRPAQGVGADVLVEASLPKFAAQSIRKVYDIGWMPPHIVSFPAASIPLTLQPAGLDKSVGLVTATFLKEPSDPTWKRRFRGRRVRGVLEEV